MMLRPFGIFGLFLVGVVESTDADQRIDGEGEDDRAALGFESCRLADRFHDLVFVFVSGEECDGIGLTAERGTDDLRRKD